MLVPAMELVFVVGTLITCVRSAAVIGGDKPESEADIAAFGGCDDGMVVNCRTLPIFNYTNIPPPPVEADGDILQDQNCPYKSLERHNRCVDVFTRRCLTDEQRRAFYTLYSVPTLEMQELCNEGGPYREDYRKHAACLRVAHAEYVQCSHRYQKELAALMVDDSAQQQQQHYAENVSNSATPFSGAEQITQNLAHLCRTFRGHLQCVHGIVKTTCGQQTEEFASQFLSQISSPLLSLCNKYGTSVQSDGSSPPSSSSSGSSARRRPIGIAWAATLTLAVTVASRGRR